ncbi:Asp-tRNA(Asn)/Glu-tRNA(Gln) amidotransferase subunit GatC [Fodinisporobacter ferrooxydans]|uniref:Aspartyl/glutamyl-tRNA(Asn/Gln) amidotransferase subunit C n=1 Tax=Fodinisporobacter ferrooxydans TaxID=2901836 RepID=A0ABY4CPQ8_9BACL|nr:Asp-tRNA(Asn)/Glu-tRNA(Gln) amidotransferase subunit GatC [Alicyclobacillaceae bacterium MYW30-H2]
MTISIQDVEHVANLARLTFTDEEKEQFADTLSKILHYADQLQELDVADVEPTSHVLHITNVVRKDEARPWLSNEEALANAPEEEDGQFRVPAVMEG